MRLLFDGDSFEETIKMRGNNPMLTSKLPGFVKFLDSLLIDFHETSLTGILLMRQSKQG